MKETNFVKSLHFVTKHGIWKHLAHYKVPNNIVRYFIYAIEDPCPTLYVGYTTNLTTRFANHKSTANSRKSNSTGLAKHFKDGCASDNGDKNKSILNVTILDCYDTTREKLRRAKHKDRYCECSECEIAKRLEHRWIARLGSMFGASGLNTKEDG